MGGKCVKCSYNQFYDRPSLTCKNICSDTEIYNGFSCVCRDGYHFIDGGCSVCPEGTTFDYTLNTCRNKCDENEFFDGSFCICRSGFKFYPIHNKCLPNCPQNLIYSLSTLSCVCPFGYAKINGKCSACPTDSEYNPETLSCDPKCGVNEVIVFSVCQCRQGYARDSDGLCLRRLCPQNSYVNKNNECICDDGYSLDIESGLCHKEMPCPAFSRRINGRCVCYDGYYLSYGKCIQCHDDSYYTGYGCSCKPGFIKQDYGKCLQPVIFQCQPN